MNLFIVKKHAKIRWLMLAAGVPMIFLFIVKIVSALLGRVIEVQDFIIPIAAILLVTAASWLIDLIQEEYNIEI
jgi:hypothetical protein